MGTTKKSLFNLTAIFHEDEKGRGFTAYFREFPNVIAVGQNEKDATTRLVELLQLALKDQAENGKPAKGKSVHSRKLSFQVV